MRFVLVVQEKNSNTVMANLNNTPCIIHVAVGIVLSNACEVLITQRNLSLHQGGLWEFPGGKIEPRETIEDALKRELREEIAIDVHAATPFIAVKHYYPDADKHVQLHAYMITQYSGIPTLSDGQLAMRWVSLSSWHINDYPVPVPNIQIMHALQNYI